MKLQRQDKELQPVVTFLEQGILPPEENIAQLLRNVILDKVLYRIDNLRKNRLRLCVPVCMKSELMKGAHGGRFAGHFLPKGVYSMLTQRYWWDGHGTGMHFRSCMTCASYQGTGRRVRPPLMPIPVGGPFYRVGVDIMELHKR